MRAYQTTRYKCDHCRKRGGRAGAMIRHEKQCAANPNRVCALCELAGEEQASLEDAKAAAMIGIKELRSVTHDCPACMLAAVIACNRSGVEPADDLRHFDAMKELKEWWIEYRKEQAGELRAYVGYAP